MDIKKLFNDDDAVSPVIGVILMVAITVILAAVIASFVLGLGDSTTTSPTAQLDFNDNGSSVTIVHQSGDTLDGNNLDIKVGGDKLDRGLDSKFTSGDEIATVNYTGSNTTASSGDTISVVWKSDSGDSSSTIGTYDIP